MGVDFISGKSKVFRKGWDRESASLACPDLFRQQPTGEARQLQGHIRLGATTSIGETLTVRLTDTGVIAYRREVVVAVFLSPPGEIVEALREGCGIATAKVEYVGLLGDTLRVSLK